PAHLREHSLEIQVPFLQSVLKDFRIVPILMGQQDFEMCTILAEGLVKAIDEDPETLLIASTDLSHSHDEMRANELDGEFIKQVRRFDPEGLDRSLSSGKCEACGGGPAVAVMLAARKLGADRALILHSAHSGDVTGDRTRVVGYMSAALIREP
ncbi:MAG: AmmeMemoRadiSam system protein B, partial [Pseudomonadota bacterium]